MKKSIFFLLIIVLSHFPGFGQTRVLPESDSAKHARMWWWREARFGMFIHWGLYAVPAGEWKGTTNHAEWIRTTAQIPLAEYDKFLSQFNPVNFNADSWVKMAKDAGMKYIVITSKHHDGFALWDSKVSDFDVMSTPFKRDILKELADACKKAGDIKLCFYHSIMDWHHPDYNQRREWEKDRPVTGTDRNRYIAFMKAQLKELLTNYGEIGVLWFDGEWEDFWTHEDGKDLYNYVKSLQPNIIINNRVDKGRSGMQGLTRDGDFAGDFGTPEQEIPATGLPGVDWESCMTMNNNWGYNKHDKNFKSTKVLVQNLVDIVSKGGNFLLNIGPKADGSFPEKSVVRLKEIGQWMKSNGQSIYQSQPSRFEKFDWGRITQKRTSHHSWNLYLHVFDWPKDGKIELKGIDNDHLGAIVPGTKDRLNVVKKGNSITIDLKSLTPDPVSTVISLGLVGPPTVYMPPVIAAFDNYFVNSTEVSITVPADEKKEFTIRYTVDTTEPNASSLLYTKPLLISSTTTIIATAYKGDKPVSGIRQEWFIKTDPQPAMDLFKADPGLRTIYYEGDWDKVPDFSQLTPKEEEILPVVSLGKYKNKEKYGVVQEGYIYLEESDVYRFHLSSDDGSKLYIDGNLRIDNDGLHGMTEMSTTRPLAAGFHSIRILFFEKTGGDDLSLTIESSKMKKTPIPAKMLFH